MIKAKLKNLIREDDKTWKKKFKIIDRTIEVEKPIEMIYEIQKDLLPGKPVRLVGEDHVDVTNLKPGNILKVFYGISFKLVGQVTILEV